MDPVDPLVVKKVEEWFLSRGVPHFIDGYSVTRDVFTRTLPALTLILLLELALALNSHWAWWVNVLVAGGLTVYVLTDTTYRHELLDDVLGEVREALAVRAVYLAAVRPPDGG